MSQNPSSAPQKQPMPNTASCRPAGRPSRGAPLTKCRAGTAIRSVRPGSASPLAGGPPNLCHIGSLLLLHSNAGREGLLNAISLVGAGVLRPEEPQTYVEEISHRHDRPDPGDGFAPGGAHPGAGG